MAGVSIPQSEYRAYPAISKSDLFKITKSPLHFKWSMENKEDKTAALIFGSACHKYILERDDFDSEFAVALNVDRRTKAGKEEYAKWLEENKWKDVVSSDDMEKIKAMAEVVDSNKFAKRLLSGEHEKSFFWTDEQTGEECKCRPDDITIIGNQHILVDYKTTDNAETEAFRASAIKYGYDLQAGMYCEGYKANTGEDAIFIFVAQEKKPPYAINILQADEYMMIEGKNLFHDLMEIYHNCKVTDNWYGYMGETGDVQSLGLPKWLQKEFE
jgi:hypothetical protein